MVGRAVSTAERVTPDTQFRQISRWVGSVKPLTNHVLFGSGFPAHRGARRSRGCFRRTRDLRGLRFDEFRGGLNCLVAGHQYTI
jgi:hypothetical protein